MCAFLVDVLNIVERTQENYLLNKYIGNKKY